MTKFSIASKDILVKRTKSGMYSAKIENGKWERCSINDIREMSGNKNFNMMNGYSYDLKTKLWKGLKN